MASSSTTRIVALLGRLRVGGFIFEPPWFRAILEGEGEIGGGSSTPIEVAVELVGKHFDQAQSQRCGLVHGKIGRQAVAIVADAEQAIGLVRLTQLESDGASAAARKGVLEAVGDQLAGDQAQGDSQIHAEVELLMEPEHNLDVSRLAGVGAEDHRGEGMKIIVEIELGEVLRAIKFFMNQGHDLDAVAALAKVLERGRIFDAAGLEVEQTGDNLEVVFDAVMNLFEQDNLLIKSFGQGSFALGKLGGAGVQLDTKAVPFDNIT